MDVSDDGRWFLMPEARVKFPYFVADNENTNLRYDYMVLGERRTNECSNFIESETGQMLAERLGRAMSY